MLRCLVPAHQWSLMSYWLLSAKITPWCDLTVQKLQEVQTTLIQEPDSTQLLIQIVVFCILIPCTAAGWHWQFWGTCCLHQSWKIWVKVFKFLEQLLMQWSPYGFTHYVVVKQASISKENTTHVLEKTELLWPHAEVIPKKKMCLSYMKVWESLAHHSYRQQEESIGVSRGSGNWHLPKMVLLPHQKPFQQIQSWW